MYFSAAPPVQVRTTHENTLEEVRKYEGRREALSTELQEVERTETTLRQANQRSSRASEVRYHHVSD